ncbi:hypothetical protein VCHA53O466_320048 [Vibrio chagasii]|nr:hypothetical protein VCHA53O466_320048 [Vibrio chagasii]
MTAINLAQKAHWSTAPKEVSDKQAQLNAITKHLSDSDVAMLESLMDWVSQEAVSEEISSNDPNI